MPHQAFTTDVVKMAKAQFPHLCCIQSSEVFQTTLIIDFLKIFSLLMS